MIQLKVNGKEYSVDVNPDTPAPLGSAGKSRSDRDQVRLRHLAVRRLYRPP